MKKNKNFIYYPGLSLIEIDKTTTKDVNQKINLEKTQQEIRDKERQKDLERRNPGCKVLKIGNCWAIKPENGDIPDFGD